MNSEVEVVETMTMVLIEDEVAEMMNMVLTEDEVAVVIMMALEKIGLLSMKMVPQWIINH